MQVLITGTSSGIGLGLAMEYLEQGDTVYGISRRENKVLTRKQNYHHLRLDLTDAEQVKKTIPGFIDRTDRIDLVVLNAGVLGQIGWMNELETAELKRVMEINVWANHALLEALFKTGREIRQVIAMSSKASIRSSPGWGPYSLSKAALNMLMDVYSRERPGTYFNAFAPGLVDSEIQETIRSIDETEKYPTIKKLQDASKTDEMPGYREAAPLLREGMKKALNYPSGSFVDVREI